MCDRVHEVRRVESLEARERSLRILDRSAEPAHEAREQCEQLGAPAREQLELARRAGQLVFEERYARAAIQAIARARELRQDAKARFADEQDVKRAVGSLLGVGDAAEAADREDRRIARHRCEAVGANGDHADLLRALQRVARQLAVARLEDEQRHRAVRQQHDIRERKQGQRLDDAHGGGA